MSDYDSPWWQARIKNAGSKQKAIAKVKQDRSKAGKIGGANGSKGKGFQADPQRASRAGKISGGVRRQRSVR